MCALLQDLCRDEPQLPWVSAAYRAFAERSDAAALSSLVRPSILLRDAESRADVTMNTGALLSA